MNNIKKLLSLGMLLTACHIPLSYAADKKIDEHKKGTPNTEVPKASVSVTKHTMKIDGHKIKYTATAGTMLMKNAKGEPIALFGYTAYVADNDNARTRPIMFAYNGGPGSASLWLHMGILGPQRAVVKDADFSSNGPFKRVNNDYSILDKADLVMIDPVGTGYSRPVGKGKLTDFIGTDQDINSVANFIQQYITENNRWQSPKYILGESYGGMRTAGLAHNLVSKHMIGINGIILVSPFMQYITGFDFGGADLPHVLFLPTFATTAWYHHALNYKPKDLQTLIANVKKFAIEEYRPALFKGNNLSDDEKMAMAKKLSHFTGLTADYWYKANLRVGHQAFTKALLEDKGETVGRIDSRFKGYSLASHTKTMHYDPMTMAVSPPILAAFEDYYRTDLQSKQDVDYKVFGNVWGKWDWSHVMPGGGKSPYPDTVADLSYAMKENPNLKVMVLEGYFDLATPFFTTDYMMDHLDIPAALQKNISQHYFNAGHMMYINPESQPTFKKDLANFIETSH